MFSCKCQKFVFVIKAREDWLIIKHTLSRYLSVHIPNPLFTYYYFVLFQNKFIAKTLLVEHPYYMLDEGLSASNPYFLNIICQ